MKTYFVDWAGKLVATADVTEAAAAEMAAQMPAQYITDDSLDFRTKEMLVKLYNVNTSYANFVKRFDTKEQAVTTLRTLFNNINAK